MMNIYEATKKAQKKGRGITRKKWMPGPDVRIIPTNSPALCLLIPYEWDGEVGKRWEPALDDLIANDWIAI